MTIRVLVADDQALIRTGLVALVTAAAGLEVAGEAADGEQAAELAARTRPDVVLMDIRMPVMDGIAATRRILSAPDRLTDSGSSSGSFSGTGSAPGDRRPRVLVLTTFDLDEYVYAALAGGASGFLLKDTPPERIVAAVHTVAGGDVLVSPRVTQRLIERFSAGRPRPAAATGLDGLTARETEVLRLVGNGLTNAQLAERLVLSEETVKTHLKRVMAKLRLSSRAQAVVVAYESGLVVPAPPR